MIEFIKEYWGALSNGALFMLVIILCILRFNLHNPPQKLSTVYASMTMIFAIWSSATILYKYFAGNKEMSLAYIVAFLINAVLGMTTLYYMRHIKLLEALLAFFFIVIIFILFNLNSIKTAVDSSDKTVLASTSTLIDAFNIKDWTDYKTKFREFFNWGVAFEEDSFFWNLLVIIVDIIKLPVFVLLNFGWFLVFIMNTLSSLFGKVSTTPTTPTTPTTGFFESIPENMNKSITYGSLLVLFMAGIFIMYTTQSAMRKNPIGVLATAFFALFAVLGFIKFFKSESFEKAFLSSIAGLFMLGIYLYNPYNILHLITGVNMFAIFVIYFFLLGMILIYNFLPETKQSAVGSVPIKYASGIADKFSGYFGKILMVLMGLMVSITLIMFLVASIGEMQDKSPTVGMYILNTLIVVGMLTIVLNAMDSNRTIRDNPFFKLALSIILYIPCLLSDLADLMMSEYYKTKYFTLIIILLEIMFIISYWVLYPEVVSKVYSGGGQVLVSDPISLNTKKTVGHYSSLSGASMLDYSNKQFKGVPVGAGSAFEEDVQTNAVSGKPMLDLSGNPLKDEEGNYYFPTKVNTYRYAISFWVYINPMPSAGDFQLSILNYGNNPNVMYNPKKNEFSVFMQSSTSDCNANLEPNEIIPVFTHLNVPLQVWFNVVLNYDGGRLDVFLNAELIKTSFDVISCIRYDELTVGDMSSRLNAKICNLTYFTEPLDIITIHTMFNITKIEDIPSVPKKDLFSI
jgi:hypothetical protein